jgi:hypothetical protein
MEYIVEVQPIKTANMKGSWVELLSGGDERYFPFMEFLGGSKGDVYRMDVAFGPIAAESIELNDWHIELGSGTKYNAMMTVPKNTRVSVRFSSEDHDRAPFDIKLSAHDI